MMVGWVCFKFRLREFYFAVVTLAFAELIRLVVLNWNDVTNGTLGLLVLDKPTIWWPGRGVVKIDGTVPWYLLTLTALGAGHGRVATHRALLDWAQLRRHTPQRGSGADARHQHLSLQDAGVHDLEPIRRPRRSAVRLLHATISSRPSSRSRSRSMPSPWSCWAAWDRSSARSSEPSC